MNIIACRINVAPRGGNPPRAIQLCAAFDRACYTHISSGLAQKNEGQCTGSTWWHAGMQGLAAPDAAARTHENPAVRAGFGRAPLGQGRDARIGNNPILIPLYLVKYTQQ